jgi:DnaJ-domain-containing protein 1
METLLLLLFLKISIPVVLFYLGLKLWNKFTEKRTDYSEEYLNFKNWYHIEFSPSSSKEIDEEPLINRVPNEHYVLVSELPTKYRNLCQVLEIPKYLSMTILKKQYRKMVQLYHPDKMPQNDLKKIQFATQKLIKAKDAYEALKDRFFQKERSTQE